MVSEETGISKETVSKLKQIVEVLEEELEAHRKRKAQNKIEGRND